MPTNPGLRSAVRRGLGVSAGVFASMALVAPAAMAQAPQPGQQAVIDEITVTGSRIRRADLESASPVTVLSRDDIVLTGLTDVGNFIQRMPSMSGSPIGTTTNNGGNGSVLIDMRGLGTDRTLTLINGQRIVDGGDFQTIPQAMIERVEVLKDGASAVYGADAVAGVVNIITRRDFEGLQLDAQWADYFDMDSGRQYSVAMLAGSNFNTTHGTGNFVFGAEYVNQEEAYQSDAPWKLLQDDYYLYPLGCEKQLFAPFDGTPEGGCLRIGSSSTEGGRFLFPTHSAGGVGPWSNRDGTGLTPGIVPYNYAPVNYIQTPYERLNLFAESHFDVTPDIRFNAAFRANYRESSQELAPLPYFSEFDPHWRPGAPISPDNYYLVQAMTAAGLAVEAPTSVRRRFSETTRRFEQEISQFQTVFGFEGRYNDMNWEVNYNTGVRLRTDVDKGQFFGPHLINAMGPSALDAGGVPRCYSDINDPDTLIPGCVPMNFFGGPGTVTQEMLDYVSVDLVDKFRTKHNLLQASITGDAFELPGGPMGWALGAAYWDQRFEYTPDSAKALDQVSGNTGAGTDGWLFANSVFGEVLLPLFDNGAQALDVSAGLRWDDYSLFGSETTWQLGVEFQVMPTLKLRGTAGTVYRAPTISDLFAGLVDSFPTFSDPCAVPPAELPPTCAQVAPGDEFQVRARVGGNPFLQPETGDTFTAGLVWTPDLARGALSLTLDYWQVDIDDAISSLGVAYILDDCYINANQSSCQLITRRPGDYGIAQILDAGLNVAKQGGKGIDGEIRYSWDTNYGQFTTSLLWAYLLERTKTAFPGDEEQKLEGRFIDDSIIDGGGYPKHKGNFSLQWMQNDLSLAYLAQYIGKLTSDGAPWFPEYTHKVSSHIYHDVVGSYEVTQTNTRVTASITNITDKEPPFVAAAFNASTSPEIYRMFGRGYWLRLEQKF
jgi:iron complex outermembrane recepter protein